MTKRIIILLIFTNTALGSIFKDFTRAEYVSKSMIEEQRVQEIVDHLEELFTPVFSYHRAKLLIQINWDDPTINLYAEQTGSDWLVHIFMGYYTLAGMSEDALALSLCHELGHHLSGYPYKSSWASAEGQADYFANHVCTGMLWEKDDNSSYRTKLPESLLKLCTDRYDLDDQIDLCSRKMQAGLSLAKVMADHSHTALENDLVKLPEVERMIYTHPTAQCRLNTFIRATLCSKKFNLRVIPGKQKAQVVPVPRPIRGVNTLWARKQSLKYICDQQINNEQIGSRPNCWFK